MEIPYLKNIEPPPSLWNSAENIEFSPSVILEAGSKFESWLFGHLASGGSLYLITTPLNVFVSSEIQNY